MTKICTRLLALLVFLPMLGFGQVGFQIAPDFFPQFTDSNGKPLAGGFVYSFSAGSSTPLATYCDNIGTANTNPIVLDSSGRPQSGSGASCGIYLSQNSYKFCVQNSSAVQIGCRDNVQNISQVLLTTANVWTAAQTFNGLINFLGGTSDTTAAEGNVFYRTDLHRLRVYDGTAWRSLIGADSTDTLTNKTINTPAAITSTLATGSAPLVIASTTPVPNLTLTAHPQLYNNSGTLLTSAKEIIGSGALTAGSLTVTFAGSFAFANTGYLCVLGNMTNANAAKYAVVSTTQITLTGTGTDNITYDCKGQ